MEDALWAQLQNTGLEEHDDKDRIEADSDEEEAQVQEVSILSPTNFLSLLLFPSVLTPNIGIICSARREVTGTTDRA